MPFEYVHQCWYAYSQGRVGFVQVLLILGIEVAVPSASLDIPYRS